MKQYVGIVKPNQDGTSWKDWVGWRMEAVPTIA